MLSMREKPGVLACRSASVEEARGERGRARLCVGPRHAPLAVAEFGRPQAGVAKENLVEIAGAGEAQPLAHLLDRQRAIADSRLACWILS
jgi:hypothetical protein